MRNGKDLRFYLKKAAHGVLVSIVIVSAIFIRNRGEFIGEFFMYETMPYYNRDTDIDVLFKRGESDDINPSADITSQDKPENLIDVVEIELIEIRQNPISGVELNNSPDDNIIKEAEALPAFKVNEVEVTRVEQTGELIGLDDVIFQPEADSSNVEEHFFDIPDLELEKLKDNDYLKNNFYIIDPQTGVKDGLLNADEFLSKDMSLSKNTDGPKVLVFHTHSQELFINSNGIMEGVVGAGQRLCEILEEKYGIQTMHDISAYDIVDGKSHILGAYERMEVNIQKILSENPSIEVIIDLHRDGVKEHIRLVDIINGKPTAQIMFFNGLSTLKESGTLKDITSLPNNNLKMNLAFSFQMQLAAKELYDGFTRKVYLHAYRYSLHMLPKSLLIEVGAQTNTKEEAFNAMEPLADVLADVILKGVKYK